MSFRNMLFIRKFTGQLHVVRAALLPDYNGADENDRHDDPELRPFKKFTLMMIFCIPRL